MFHKILVAIDTPEKSQFAFEYALDLAQKVGAEMLLCHILSADATTAPLSTFVPYYYPAMTEALQQRYVAEWSAAEQRGLDMLRSLLSQATVSGVTAEFTQNVGEPGKLICEIAKSWQADLIVLEKRGLTGLNELLAGSVSNYVFHHALCPVLTVPS